MSIEGGRMSCPGEQKVKYILYYGFCLYDYRNVQSKLFDEIFDKSGQKPDTDDPYPFEYIYRADERLAGFGIVVSSLTTNDKVLEVCPVLREKRMEEIEKKWKQVELESYLRMALGYYEILTHSNNH